MIAAACAPPGPCHAVCVLASACTWCSVRCRCFVNSQCSDCIVSGAAFGSEHISCRACLVHVHGCVLPRHMSACSSPNHYASYARSIGASRPWQSLTELPSGIKACTEHTKHAPEGCLSLNLVPMLLAPQILRQIPLIMDCGNAQGCSCHPCSD